MFIAHARFLGSPLPFSFLLLQDTYIVHCLTEVEYLLLFNTLVLFSSQEQVELKISCSGVLNAIACSPDQNYCVGAVEEKIHVWQVNNIFPWKFLAVR